MRMKYDVRSCVAWADDGAKKDGVIIAKDKLGIKVVEVLSSHPGIKYYDKGGSKESRDAHNVKLTSCPAINRPFGNLCSCSQRGECYAYANPMSVETFTEEDIEAGVVKQTYEGKQISMFDHSEILSHYWFDEFQADPPPHPGVMRSLERDLGHVSDGAKKMFYNAGTEGIVPNDLTDTVRAAAAVYSGAVPEEPVPQMADESAAEKGTIVKAAGLLPRERAMRKADQIRRRNDAQSQKDDAGIEL